MKNFLFFGIMNICTIADCVYKLSLFHLMFTSLLCTHLASLFDDVIIPFNQI